MILKLLYVEIICRSGLFGTLIDNCLRLSGLNTFLFKCLIHLIDQSLWREKVLPIFELDTGQDDHAKMFWDDYLCQVC